MMGGATLFLQVGGVIHLVNALTDTPTFIWRCRTGKNSFVYCVARVCYKLVVLQFQQILSRN